MPTTPTDADLADFLDEIGWQPTTLASARSVLCQWERWLGDTAPMAATHRDLKAWLADAETAGIAPSTRHKRWQIVGAVYAWAARPIGGTVVAHGRYKGRRLPGAGILADNPMIRVPEPFVPTTPKVRMAAAADVHALEEYFGAVARKVRTRRDGEYERALRDAAMVSVMFRSGCRVGELPWIDLAHLVRDDAGTVVACHIGGDDGSHAKNGRRRIVPVLDETPRLLERYLRRRGAAPGPLFLGRAGHTAALDRRLQSGAIRQVVARAARRVGVDVSSHDMRRGWAVESKRRGVDNLSIKKAAGWSSDAMLDRYFGAEAGTLAVEAFHDAAAAAAVNPQRRLRVAG